jgi:hypothetical protein
MTPAQKRAYVLADNKLALNAGWDEELLAEEIKSLLEINLDFDIAITGFSIPEIDSLIEGLQPEEPSDPAEDRLPTEADCAARCRPGDIWQLGRHRLMCGNALDENVVLALMNGEVAGMIFTDPPYNVRMDGNVCGSGSVQHREFAMAAGEMSRHEFTGFLRAAFKNLVMYSVDGAIHFICMDWRHLNEIMQAGEDTYTELKNLIVWAKDNGGWGRFIAPTTS